jgi:hypothetical protein
LVLVDRQAAMARIPYSAQLHLLVVGKVVQQMRRETMEAMAGLAAGLVHTTPLFLQNRAAQEIRLAFLHHKEIMEVT